MRRLANRWVGAALAVGIGCAPGAALAQPQPAQAALDALVAAYPEALERHDGTHLYWRDGTKMAVDDGVADKPFEQLLRSASILDQFRIPYRRGAPGGPPARNEDPGRIRNAAFFRKMYGDCQQGAVERRLVSVSWLPSSWGNGVRVTPVNGIPQRLRAVSDEIEKLPSHIRRAAYPIAGVYNCRKVADTGQPSMHGTAAAIDLNTAFADYWFWQKPKTDPIAYRNRMPPEIVAAFEKHGFIWGGKWYHYDTMHFEYRPELLGIDNR
jgi:hypothetical protein